MDAHLSTVSVFQRASGHNVFLCTFPIMVAQISLTNHSSSYLPSLVTYNERRCSGDSTAAKSEEEGRVARRGGLLGGGGSKKGLSISMEALLPREEFFCLYRCSLGKKDGAKCRGGRTEAGAPTRSSKSSHPHAHPQGPGCSTQVTDHSWKFQVEIKYITV